MAKLENKNREQLNALAIELGLDETAVTEAEDKAAVIAMIESDPNYDTSDSSNSDAIVDVNREQQPALPPDPASIEPNAQISTDADMFVFGEDREQPPAVFIVNGQRVDFDGKPVKG